MYCVDLWTSLKMVCSEDMARFACHNDRRIGSFSTKNTPILLDTITNGLVYEPLARSDNYLNWSDFLWPSWLLGLTAFCWLELIVMTSARDLSSWPNCKCGCSAPHGVVLYTVHILVVTPVHAGMTSWLHDMLYIILQALLYLGLLRQLIVQCICTEAFAQ